MNEREKTILRMEEPMFDITILSHNGSIVDLDESGLSTERIIEVIRTHLPDVLSEEYQLKITRHVDSLEYS
jgi:hypothetical protein